MHVFLCESSHLVKYDFLLQNYRFRFILTIKNTNFMCFFAQDIGNGIQNSIQKSY